MLETVQEFPVNSAAMPRGETPAHKYQKCANADTIICVYDATFLCHPIQEKHDTMEHCQLKNSTPNYHDHDFTKNL